MRCEKGIRPIVILLLLFVATGLYGKQLNETNNIERPNSILFSPLNLFDPINPSFQMGYERMLSPKWAVQVEGGYIINKGLINLLLNP